jgi:hypothetical protein
VRGIRPRVTFDPGCLVYTRGWDRAPVKVGSEGKQMKRQINTVWIYPPASGDRRDILAAAVPGQHRKAST